MKELEFPFDGDYILKRKKSIKKQLLNEHKDFLEKRIAILGGSTTNDIKLILEIFLLNYGIRPLFYESEYNQYYQDAVFSNKELEDFAPDIIYVHTSNRNIERFPRLTDSKTEVGKLLDTEFQKYERIWEALLKRYGCPVIQNNFELPFYRLLGNKEAGDYRGKVNYISKLNLRFYDYASEHDKFFINDINYLSASYGLENWSDPFYWHMYKYALSVPAIPYLAFNIANIIKSLYGKNKKAVSLDLDNTLWGGVIGDDGVNNIMLGPETSMGQVYREFQEYIKELKQMGIVLNINSKNDYENAVLGLEHPDAVLTKEDFIMIKANWEPKDKNLLETAEELNLLPESFVFVDDNPAERELVSTQLPEVAVPKIDRVEHYINILDKSGFFEVTNFSKDDFKRNEMYKENIKRKAVRDAFSDYKEYLLSLEMQADIKNFEAVYMARIAQLTNKSNQFNLTTRRYTQPEIEVIAQDKNYIAVYGKLQDKFGDNGVVSVVIGRCQEEKLHIELWIMSCRVLKRDMEYAMMDEVVKRAQAKGIKTIEGYYYPTAKNKMVKDFYEIQGFEKIKEDDEGNTIWLLDISKGYQNKNKVILVNSNES